MIEFGCNHLDVSSMMLLMTSLCLIAFSVYWTLYAPKEAAHNGKIVDVVSVFAMCTATLLSFLSLLMLAVSWRRTTAGFRGISNTRACDTRWLWIHWYTVTSLSVLLFYALLLGNVFQDQLNDYFKKTYQVPLFSSHRITFDLLFAILIFFLVC